MSDDKISQAEIDALLNGMGGGDAPAGDDSSSGDAAPADEAPAEAAAEAPAAADSADDSSQFEGVLSDIEKDALGEIGNISMGSAATTLSVLLGHKVNITTPAVAVSTMSIIRQHYPMPYLIVEVGYTIGINGNNVLAIQAQDAAIIADLMMGGDGTNPEPEINEIHMSAVGESMNQVNLIDLGTEDKVSDIVNQDEPIVRIAFRMEVDGLIDSEIMQILPVDVAKEMVQALMNGEVSSPEPEPEPAPAPAAAAPAPQPAPAPAPAPAPQPQMAAPQPQPMMQQPMMQQPMMMAPQPQMGYAMPPQQPHVAQNVPVQPAQFTPLSTAPVQVNDANIGLILDVPLQVTVELGRTKKSIKDILEMTNGSIVELDKLAGEPVDIQVNGKFLAKGEVVVIDENFGVRITEIASPEERAAKLQ